MERGHRYSCEAQGISWFDFISRCSSSFHIALGYVNDLKVSSDGSAVVGSSKKVVIAHNTGTGAVLWQKEMPGIVWTLHIHGGVVVVPVNNRNTVVFDLTTGHQIHTLPSAGQSVRGICVFDGLIGDLDCFVIFSHTVFSYAAPLTKIALKVEDTVAGPGLLNALFFFSHRVNLPFLFL